MVSGKKRLPRLVGPTVHEGAQEWTCDAIAGNETQGHPGQSGFRLLDSGDEAFLARASLIARAQRSLDLQYYLFGTDTSGALLSNSILQAADRGVRVRLLVDGWSLVFRKPEAALLNLHPNVSIRLFNPVARDDGLFSRLISLLAESPRVNRRMHNKVFIADGKIVIMGGRNVGDRYFGFSADLEFRDLDVICAGTVVQDICASFEAYWNSPAARTLRSVGIRNRSAAEFARFRNRLAGLRKQQRIASFEAQLAATGLARDLSRGRLDLAWAQARLIVDPPDKISWIAPPELSTLDQLVELAQSVKRELLLVSPYFVPGERGLAVLRQLRARDVRVVLVTNSLASTDIPMVHAGYRRYRRDLLEIGVEVHETRRSPDDDAGSRKLFRRGRASLHAKAYVLDRKHVVIGSPNLDPRSMILNTEIGVVVSSEQFARSVARFANDLARIECSYRLGLEGESANLVWDAGNSKTRSRYLREPGASVWRRLLVFLISSLPIEKQL
ncbi:MAG: phospholipase D family protein [Burkholderiales bacterium]|jgi:putative cardiolipin synthase